MKQSRDNEVYWERIYSNPAYVYGTSPNRYLVAQQPRLKPGMQALAIGDGEGRNGVWLARQGLKQPPENWDHAEQLCLALLALNQAHRDHLREAKKEPSSPDERTEAALKEIARKLAFPKGRESPVSFRGSAGFDEELAELLKQIAQTQP